MYGWLWRKLPGPTFVKGIESLVLVALVVVLLFLVVFPWVTTRLPFDRVTVNSQSLTSTKAVR